MRAISLRVRTALCSLGSGHLLRRLRTYEAGTPDATTVLCLQQRDRAVFFVVLQDLALCVDGVEDAVYAYRQLAGAAAIDRVLGDATSLALRSAPVPAAARRADGATLFALAALWLVGPADAAS